MRKALVIGIDYYKNVSCLNGCVNDANAVKGVLERNGDGSLNFDVKMITNSSAVSYVSKEKIFEEIGNLFLCDDTALLYFSGHGASNNSHGFLITSECKSIIDGIGMDYILSLANNSKAKNRIIILDCCHAGHFGGSNAFNKTAVLDEGVTILSACKSDESAIEKSGNGLFTGLLVDALNGSAADLIGQISPGSIYSHIDQSLGAWEQRPVFKTNIEYFISLRNVQPNIEINELREIVNLFPYPNNEFELNRSYEESCASEAKPENVVKFKILQKMFKVNLVRPIGEEYMYYAALKNKSCKLTALGVHYWNLVTKKRI